MTIQDYDDVIKLWAVTENLSMRSVDSRENIDFYLKRNPALSFVALVDGVVVGAVLSGTDGRRGYLQHLAVDIVHREKGIARALVNKTIAAMANQGISKTHLFVLNNNAKAKEFYENIGWLKREEVTMYSFNSSADENV
jgi:ribosomal protein S18 acetylase RimI-like enzyme